MKWYMDGWKDGEWMVDWINEYRINFYVDIGLNYKRLELLEIKIRLFCIFISC